MATETWPRPIPVTERLPDSAALCLAYCRETDNYNEVWSTAYFDSEDKEWHLYFCRDEDWNEFSSDGLGVNFSADSDFITHWLPMPPAPE